MKILTDNFSNADLICDVVLAALTNLDSEHVKQYRASISTAGFRAEYGTVKIKLARRMGHTTAAIQLLVASDDALLFVSSPTQQARIRQQIKEFTKHYITRTNIEHRVLLVGDELNKNLIPVLNRTMVILDAAATFTTDCKNKVLSEFNTTRLIVELQ